MRDLSWVRKQGEIVAREKKKMRQRFQLSLKKKLNWYADVCEAFEKRMDDTESVYRTKRLSEMIPLEEKVRSINALKEQVGTDARKQG